MKQGNLAIVILACMLAIPGVAVSGPPSGDRAQNQEMHQIQVKKGKVEQNQGVKQQEIWGDPEESMDNESTWTWFGMGYEQRNSVIKSSGGEQMLGSDSGGPAHGAGVGGSKGPSRH